MIGLDIFCGSNAPVVGAGAMPAFSQLQPYFLTEYPTSGEQLTALYEGYLRAYDALINDIFSAWHPVSTGTVTTALRAARSKIVDLWAKGGVSAIMAVQMLAALMGWFNATYRRPTGEVDWPALNQPVNAGVIAAANDAAKATVDAAKAAGKAVGDGLKDVAKTAWWTTTGLVLAGMAVVVLLGWKLIGSGAGQAAVARYLPGKRS